VAHSIITTAGTLARVLIGTWLLIGPPAAHGLDSPARLREDEESIESGLRVPDGLEWGRYDVHCEVRVLSSGIPFDATCYALVHKRLGLFYIAPQRFNEFSWGFAYEGSPPGTLIWQELWIDEHGNVTKSQTTNVSGARVKDVEAVRRSVANMQFMPGFFEGKPVPMRYVEPAFSSGK
jgi:hypothetical protein